MPNPQMIQIDEEQDIVCPVCGVTILDSEELHPQPSCPHVRFVYANGEAFEYCKSELEALLAEEESRADEQDEFFDTWEALRRHSGPNDLILKQTEESMACGLVSFTVWVGIRNANLPKACDSAVAPVLAGSRQANGHLVGQSSRVNLSKGEGDGTLQQG